MRARAFGTLMLLSFTSLTCYSIVIPDSIALATALNESFAASAGIVSFFRLGTGVRNLSVWLI